MNLNQLLKTLDKKCAEYVYIFVIKRNYILILIFGILFLLSSFSGACDEPEVSKGEIIVQISGLRNNNGIIRTLLFNKSKGFPENHRDSFALKNVMSNNDSALVVFNEIP